MHVMYCIVVVTMLASGHDSVSGSQCTASRDCNVID